MYTRSVQCSQFVVNFDTLQSQFVSSTYIASATAEYPRTCLWGLQSRALGVWQFE